MEYAVLYGMDHAVFDRNGLCCVGLKWTMLCWTEMDCTVLDRNGPCRVGLKWTMLCWTGLDYVVLD